LLTVGPSQALAYHPASGVFLDFAECQSRVLSLKQVESIKSRRSSKEYSPDDDDDATVFTTSTSNKNNGSKDQRALHINIDCQECNYYEVRIGKYKIVKHGVLSNGNYNRYIITYIIISIYENDIYIFVFFCLFF